VVGGAYSTHPTAQLMQPGLLELELEDAGAMPSGEARVAASWRLSKFPYTEPLAGTFGQLEALPASQWSLLVPQEGSQGAWLTLSPAAPEGWLTSPVLSLASLLEPAVSCAFAVAYPASSANGSAASVDVRR
jgi:hypothetical protein